MSRDLMMPVFAGSDIPITLQREIDRLAGKGPIDLLMLVSTERTDSLADRKSDVLADINTELGTRYDVTHLNNWLSGRKKTPQRVCAMARRCVLCYLLGDENAAKLVGMQ